MLDPGELTFVSATTGKRVTRRDVCMFLLTRSIYMGTGRFINHSGEANVTLEDSGMTKGRKQVRVRQYVNQLLIQQIFSGNAGHQKQGRNMHML